MISSAPHIKTDPLTLETVKKEFLDSSANFTKQLIIGAPGIGKDVTGKTLIDMGIDVYPFVFSDYSTLFGEKYPEVQDEIDMYKSAGLMIPNHIVGPIYNWSKHDIEQNLSEGKTVLFDGFPRTATQVPLFTQSKDRFDNVVHLREPDPYTPIMRQQVRELVQLYTQNELKRKDAFKAVGRAKFFYDTRDDLVEAVRETNVTDRFAEFTADGNPAQNTFLYLTMAVHGLEEEEIRDIPEYARLGTTMKFPELYLQLQRAKLRTHTLNRNTINHIHELTLHYNQTKHAFSENIPFTEFYQDWQTKFHK